MKKVLILAYDFPPYTSVGGQRPNAWMQYLSSFGVFPVVITRNWSEVGDNVQKYNFPDTNKSVIEEKNNFFHVIKVPYKGNFRDKLIKRNKLNSSIIRKMLSLFYKNAELFSFKADGRSPLFFEADKYLTENKIDIIIATGEPFILFRYATILSKKHQIPWIADYRDAWTTNFNMSHFNFIERILKSTIVRKKELRWVNTASVITTVSEAMITHIKDLFPNKEFKLVMNGFFHEDFEGLKIPEIQEDTLVIAYSGSLYPYQRLEAFLEALFLVIDNSKVNIRVDFYGMKMSSMRYQQVLLNYPRFHEICRLIDKMPRKKLLDNLRDADVLLLLASEKIDGSCAKVFEYIALEKPILLSVNDRATLEMLLKDNPNAHLCNNVEEIKNVLNQMIEEKEQNKVLASRTINSMHYSRKYQTQILSEVILDIVK